MVDAGDGAPGLTRAEPRVGVRAVRGYVVRRPADRGIVSRRCERRAGHGRARARVRGRRWWFRPGAGLCAERPADDGGRGDVHAVVVAPVPAVTAGMRSMAPAMHARCVVATMCDPRRRRCRRGPHRKQQRREDRCRNVCGSAVEHRVADVGARPYVPSSGALRWTDDLWRLLAKDGQEVGG